MAWVVTACSIRGETHKATDMPCREFTSYFIKDNVLFAAMARGKGTSFYSQARSQEGANLIVQKFLDYAAKENLENFKKEQFIIKFVLKLHYALLNYANAQGRNITDFATTFLGAIVSPHWRMVLQIGEGIIIGRNTNDYEILIEIPRASLSPDSYFLAEKDPLIKIQIEEKPLKFLMFATRGIENITLDQETLTLRPNLIKSFEACLRLNPFQDSLDREVENFLTSPHLNERVGEDKSLLIAGWVD